MAAVHCVRGFMKASPKVTAAMVLKKFHQNCQKAGVKVHRVIHIVNVGDNVFSIVANVSEAEK